MTVGWHVHKLNVPNRSSSKTKSDRSVLLGAALGTKQNLFFYIFFYYIFVLVFVFVFV